MLFAAGIIALARVFERDAAAAQISARDLEYVLAEWVGRLSCSHAGAVAASDGAQLLTAVEQVQRRCKVWLEKRGAMVKKDVHGGSGSEGINSSTGSSSRGSGNSADMTSMD